LSRWAIAFRGGPAYHGDMIGEPVMEPAALRARAERAVEHAAGKLRAARAAWRPEMPAPVHTRNGRWYRPATSWTDWTPGFYAGQMWILERLTGDVDWLNAARLHTRPLAARRFDREVHDLGFIFLPSYGRWHERLRPGEPERDMVREVLVTAGTVQSFRWTEASRGPAGGGFVYSFNGPQSLFIDTLMNIRLLFWAHRNGAPEEVGRRALEHARTSLRWLVARNGAGLGDVDGRVAHEAIFNAEAGRGEFRCLSTQQGWSPFTAWARGQAWAIYGFAEAHAATGAGEFLDAVERCAGYYLEEVRADGVPFWDFGAPAIPREPLDSSAAAVAACGLSSLSERTADAARGAAYRRGARRILETLLTEEFLTVGRSDQEGILLHGTYHRPRGWGVDESVIWGDYFFLELIERFLAEEKL
jgi:unsaturated chondroitin disaccharide hydrolase